MLKIGTVGTSWITQSFIEATKTAGNIEFTSCYSRDINKAIEFAETNGAQYSFCDIEIMAKTDYIDAVYIASPNSLHYSQSKLFLENGKHVIVEKPATTTLEEYTELSELAEAKGLVYMEAIMSIHTPGFQILKNAIAEIGNIRTVNFVFCQLSSKYNAYVEGKNPNIFNPKFHTGCLMDIGIYNIYLAVALFGEPDKITSDAMFLDSGADCSGVCILNYGTFNVNLIYSKVGQNYSPSEIIGDKGTISIDSISQINGVDITRNGEKQIIIQHDIPRNIIMSGEAGYFRDQIAVRNLASSEYIFSQKTALTVRNVCDEIRRQNRFSF